MSEEKLTAIKAAKLKVSELSREQDQIFEKLMVDLCPNMDSIDVEKREAARDWLFDAIYNIAEEDDYFETSVAHFDKLATS
jgi:hypothetical protein